MHYSRLPCLALRPFVKRLWVSCQAATRPACEHVLPTGDMHLVFRLRGAPLRLVNEGRPASEGFSSAVIGGPRTTFYGKWMGDAVYSVGVQFYPGVAEPLFGVPADTLAERHTNLDAVWGHHAEQLWERLLAAPTPEEQLGVLETVMLARLPGYSLSVSGVMHPAISFGLGRFAQGATVTEVVRESGYSHRYFNALFKRATGLSSKAYCRVRRLQHVLAAPRDTALAELALAAGFADQAHLQREFRALTGVTPLTYRHLAPQFTHHLQVNFLQDRG